MHAHRLDGARSSRAALRPNVGLLNFRGTAADQVPMRTRLRNIALSGMLAFAILGFPATPAVAAQRAVAAWLPYWDHSRGVAAFQAHASQYSELSPFWYALSASGSVTAYPNAEARSVVDAARKAGVPLLPTISNEFDGRRVATMLADSRKRNAHVNTLVSLARTKGYAGIDVDYEGLAAGDRDRFTRFVRELGSALRRAGKRLSVTVHPKTSEPGTWDGPKAQDYAAIGAAADRVRLMAYDYHWATSAAGPVAPAGWVDDVARFAASVITPSKIQLGLPLYGYDWVGSKGEGVTYDQVRARVERYAATVRWSEQDKESWFTYRDAAGASHTVWFADERSTQAKLASVTRHKLGGVVFWRLGGEDAGVWNATSATFQGSGATSASVDATAPSVRITSPRPNRSVSAPRQRVDFVAADSTGVVRTELYVDGRIVSADTTGRPNYTVATTRWAKGKHRLTVRALDRAGNASTSTVYVSR